MDEPVLGRLSSFGRGQAESRGRLRPFFCPEFETVRDAKAVHFGMRGRVSGAIPGSSLRSGSGIFPRRAISSRDRGWIWRLYPRYGHPDVRPCLWSSQHRCAICRPGNCRERIRSQQLCRCRKKKSRSTGRGRVRPLSGAPVSSKGRRVSVLRPAASRVPWSPLPSATGARSSA